jgi:phytoene dehydrogenase-like protein
MAARGHAVEAFEKNAWLGGKAAQLREDGFRFDMGPTILIQPSVLRKIFAEVGKTPESYVEMVRLDPHWRCFFDDGATIECNRGAGGAEAHCDDAVAGGAGAAGDRGDVVDGDLR